MDKSLHDRKANDHLHDELTKKDNLIRKLEQANRKTDAFKEEIMRKIKDKDRSIS